MNVGLRSGYAVLEHINPNIEDAARNLGEKELRIFFRIVFSFDRPGVP